jgi:choice-of-anchor A domain-containing protein
MDRSLPRVVGAGCLALIALSGCRTTVQDVGTGDALDAGTGDLHVSPYLDGEAKLDANMLGYGWGGEPCDGVDNDGDGKVDEGWADSDGDGTADCVDSEECDGLDNDGDGAIDEGLGCVVSETCAVAYDEDPSAHAFWLPGVHRNLVFESPAEFVEYSDGTAVMTGTLTDGTGGGFEVEVEFAGGTATAPAGSPKLELSGSSYVPTGAIDPSTWSYYEDFKGELVGTGTYAGGAISFERMGPAFQTGEGANGKDGDDGASGWFTYTVDHAPSGSGWASSGVGDINVDFAACGGTGGATECETYSLGDAQDWNVFVLGNYRWGWDVQGRVAAGGNVTMEYFSLGQSDPGGIALVVGDWTGLTSGTVYGDVVWNNGRRIADDVTFAGGGTEYHGSPIDFVAAQTHLEDLASDLSDLPANGTTSVSAWGEVRMTGTNPAMNIFEVDGADLADAVYIDIDAPAGSFVVINVAGGVGFDNLYINLSGVDEQHLLWNFHDATWLDFEAIGLRGTFLAPSAHTCFDNGNFDGQIISYHLYGDAEGHHFPFAGDFEVCLEDTDGDGVVDSVVE